MRFARNIFIVVVGVFLAAQTIIAQVQETPARRKPARPILSPTAAADLAAQLREQYSKPPAEWPKAELIDHPEVKFAELGKLPPVQHPDDNPFTREKSDLGWKLFFDARMSSSKQIACATCHDPDLGWADGRAVAFGHDRQTGNRNAPSVLNGGYFKEFFWDGRSSSLESQARNPVRSEIEMHSSPDFAVEQIKAIPGYRPLFKAAFGDEEIDFDRIGKAIATFERTIVAGRSDFDRFLGGEHEVMSDSAVRGLHLFRTTAGCINCHNGPNFSDDQYHNLGLTFYGRKLQDLGRYEVTKEAKDVGRFRTPTLRNVTRTAPYMHNGAFEMDGLLNAYSAGMFDVRPSATQANDPLFPKKSPLLKRLDLNDQEKEDLKSFMQSLEEPKLRRRAPDLP